MPGFESKLHHSLMYDSEQVLEAQFLEGNIWNYLIGLP